MIELTKDQLPNDDQPHDGPIPAEIIDKTRELYKALSSFQDQIEAAMVARGESSDDDKPLSILAKAFLLIGLVHAEQQGVIYPQQFSMAAQAAWMDIVANLKERQPGDVN